MDVFMMDWYQNVMRESEANNTCLYPRYTTTDWVTISLPISMVIIIFFSFLQRRKKLALGCLGGRPGTVYPVDVLDTYTDRTTYALAFCVCCISILDLFVGNYYFSFDTSHLPSMVRGAVTTLLGVVNVIIVGVVHYPLFLCLTVRNKLSGNLVGVLYSVLWSFFYFLGFVDCVRSGDWLSSENIVRNLTVVPINFCYVYLNLRFLIGVCYYLRVCRTACKKCHESTRKNEIRLKDEYFERTHFYRRVTYLLQPAKDRTSIHSSSSSRIMLLMRKLYPSYPGFKYSRRIVCTITLSMLCLYEFGVLYTVEFSEFARDVKDVFILPEEGLLLRALDEANVSSIYYDSKDLVVTLTDTLMPTSVIALVFMVVSMFHVLIVYRNDTVRIWGGDRSSFPVQPYSYSKKVVANLTYSGYQIAYCIWGFMMLHLVLWLVVVVVWYFILGPLVYNVRRDNIVLQLLRDYWLGLVVTLLIFYGQVLASRLFFLQKYGKNFGINNRRSYHNMVYFTLFLNVIVGIASCLLRMLKVLFFGIFLIGRIDYCLMYPGLEYSDKGYRAYVGFLELEVIHTHPVIVTFCHCLWQVARTESDRRGNMEKVESESQISERRRRKMIRNKWQLGYTLVRNPVLLRDRLSNLIDLRYGEEHRAGLENGGLTIEMDCREDNANPTCFSEDHSVIEMNPSYRKRNQRGKGPLDTVTTVGNIGHTPIQDVQGSGDTVQDYSFPGREHEAVKGYVDSVSMVAGYQRSWYGKGSPPNNVGNLEVGDGLSPNGQVNDNGTEKTKEVSLHTVRRSSVQNNDSGDESFRRPDAADTVTTVVMPGNVKSEMHQQPEGWSHTEATEVPVGDHIRNSHEAVKASGCRSGPEGSGEDNAEDDPLNGSLVSVFSHQSLQELLESSLDPEHVSDCRQQGLDLVSYVEEEMWKNLLHEGKSTLKRAKQKEQRTDEAIDGSVGQTHQLTSENTKKLEEISTRMGVEADSDTCKEVKGEGNSGTLIEPIAQENESEDIRSSWL